MGANKAVKMPVRGPEPYKIEAAPMPERYARGWHCLGLATDYTEKPVRLNYFGTKLVAYRGAGGQVHILDAYCPHMGADLCDGVVEENSIRCPFHAWRWGPDGICDEIPYADRIPEKAVIKSWPTMEENNLLFVWNDHENNPPIPEQCIPRIDDCFSDKWTNWYMDEPIKIDVNCRELVDNMADIAHFGPVHGAPISVFSNTVEGHTFQQDARGSSDRLGEAELTSVATYYGPAYMNTYMTGQIDGMEIASRLLVTHVPITTESFDLRFGIMVRKIEGLSEEQNQETAEEYVKLNRTSFYEDRSIWQSKVRVDNPLLCDGDGPINKLRQWHSQFYQDIKDVSPNWKKRKTYEVDVKKPNSKRVRPDAGQA